MTDNEIIKELNLRIDSFSRETLDLINRQKAEIEKLENDFVNVTKIAKSEAVKEFAERLCNGRVSNDPVVIAVKVELTEMTEVNENDRE